MDHFRVLKRETIQAVFKDEFQYIVDHRWDIATQNANWLILLDGDRMSLHHLDQIQRRIRAEKASAAKAEEEKNKVTRQITDPRQLTGATWRQ
jgi:hypothetical protein